jgi:protein-ribulosamine 3-kinase
MKRAAFDKRFFETILSDHIGPTVAVKSIKEVGGGCINDAYKILSTAGTFFVKCNSIAVPSDLFEKEKRGLLLLGKASDVKVPEVIGDGGIGNVIYLILEYIESAPPQSDYWENLGFALAGLHKNTNTRFGLEYNNYIGSLPQSNDPSESWVEFFIENRLKPQLKIANEQGKAGRLIFLFDKLFKKLPQLLPQGIPSLLHGDLWSGNVLVDEKGAACLIDPAVHYGHREAEISFTHLFGGFEQKFYEGYNESFPLEPAFEERIELYNLYPLMVHVNLFGGSYINSVENSLKKFI